MSVYNGTPAEQLDASLDSIFRQTRRADQIVLVVDGPVNNETERVIKRYADRLESEFEVLRNKHVQGLGEALQLGLGSCKEKYVARMDADDICVDTRFAQQLEYIQQNPELDVVATWHEEFTDHPGDRGRIKSAPTQHDQIQSVLKRRCVISHPTIFFKRYCVNDIGGYRAKYAYLEDYDLYMRLFASGYRFACLPEPLVHVRSGLDQVGRRGGFSYVVNDVSFRWECYRRGNYGLPTFVFVSAMMLAFRLMPTRARSFFYRFVRSKHPEHTQST